MPTELSNPPTDLAAATAPKVGNILDHYYDLRGLAQYLDCCARTVERNLLAAGDAPPSITVGKRRLWKKSTVQKWLADREQRPLRRRV